MNKFVFLYVWFYFYINWVVNVMEKFNVCMVKLMGMFVNLYYVSWIIVRFIGKGIDVC